MSFYYGRSEQIHDTKMHFVEKIQRSQACLCSSKTNVTSNNLSLTDSSGQVSCEKEYAFPRTILSRRSLKKA